MKHTSFFLLGMALLLLQENMFRVFRVLDSLTGVLHLPGHVFLTPGLTPALTLPLLLFLGIREYPFVAGAALAFVYGYASDVLGIAPVGLYTFAMVALFLMARALGLRLATQTRLPQVLVTAGFTAAKSGIVLVCLGIFGKEAWIARSVYPYLVPHVISTALCAPFVFSLAERTLELTQGRLMNRSREP